MIVKMKCHRIYLCFLMVTTSTILLCYYQISEDKTSGFRRQNMPLDMKYILVWTEPTRDPIMHLGVGQTTFLERNCPVSNCFVSPHRGFFQYVTDFDALIFHAPELVKYPSDLPETRAPHQLYVLTSMESAGYYPLCKKQFNTYFNRTWTYKLKSDAVYGYITIKNKKGHVIGPKETMYWKDVTTMKPINNTLKTKLSSKKYAAAWFVSNCYTPSGRETVAREIQKELQKLGLTLDIYGRCGTKTCHSKKMKTCFEMVERDYYFYLSFENSFSEDYVTEKLLRPLLYYTVPIVYGGANYTRFMPDGIYLDANKTDAPELARQMAYSIKNKEEYYNFFKWHNYYSYHDVLESPQTDPYCKLCALIHNESFHELNTVNNNMTAWWNSPGTCAPGWFLRTFTSIIKYFGWL